VLVNGINGIINSDMLSHRYDS